MTVLVKTIVLSCFLKYGHNIQYPKTFQDMDPQVSRCTDYVTKCYYKSLFTKGLGDVNQCLRAETPNREEY